MSADRRYRWVLVLLLACVGGLNYADRSAIASIFPVLRSEFGMTDLQLAAVGTCFLWAYIPASPLAGMLADRYSRRRLIILSLAGWSLVTLLTGIVANPSQLLATRAALGLFEAAYIPAALALIAEHHPGRTRATAFGLFTGGSSLGVVAGGTGLGYITEHFSWRWGFFALGGAGFVFVALARWVLRPEGPSPLPERARGPGPALFPGLAEMLRIPSFCLIVAAGMAVAVSNWNFLNWLPLYFKETYRTSLAGAGFAGTFLHQGGGVAAGLLGGIFSDRVAAGRPSRRLTIQAVSCFIAAPLLWIFFLPHPAISGFFLCVFSYSFLLSFGTSNVTPVICEILPRRLRSTAIGLTNATNCLAGGFGIMMAGFLKSRLGLGAVFGGISGMILISAALIFLASAMIRKESAPNRSGRTATAVRLPQP